MITKKVLIVSGVLLASAGLAFGAQQPFGSDGFGKGFYDNGTSIPTGGLTFQLGTFGSFTPTAANADLWAANWSTTGITSSTASWTVAAADFGSFSGTANIGPTAPTGQSGYIWGYSALDVGSEWILVSNSNWTIPAHNPDATAFPLSPWQTTAAGTFAIVGQLNHVGVGAADRTFQTEVIPEPSTYALIVGLGILGFLGYRRFRK